MQTQTYGAGSTRYRYYFRSDNTLSTCPSTAKEGVKVMEVMKRFFFFLSKLTCFNTVKTSNHSFKQYQNDTLKTQSHTSVKCENLSVIYLENKTTRTGT